MYQIIGLPGAGKSTIAERLSKELGLNPLREVWEDNPWLAKAWQCVTDHKKDPSIFNSQYWFLSQYLGY